MQELNRITTEIPCSSSKKETNKQKKRSSLSISPRRSPVLLPKRTQSMSLFLLPRRSHVLFPKKNVKQTRRIVHRNSVLVSWSAGVNGWLVQSLQHTQNNMSPFRNFDLFALLLIFSNYRPYPVVVQRTECAGRFYCNLLQLSLSAQHIRAQQASVVINISCLETPTLWEYLQMCKRCKSNAGL